MTGVRRRRPTISFDSEAVLISICNFLSNFYDFLSFYYWCIALFFFYRVLFLCRRRCCCCCHRWFWSSITQLDPNRTDQQMMQPFLNHWRISLVLVQNFPSISSQFPKFHSSSIPSWVCLWSRHHGHHQVTKTRSRHP